MTWLELFLAGLAGLAGVFIFIAIGHIPDDWCDCATCREGAAPLEVWLEQPVREACALNDDEQDAWQRITQRESK